MYGTPKYISIAVTSKPAHLINIDNIVAVTMPASSNTTTLVELQTQTITLTHAADASLENLTAINTALETAATWNVAKKGAKATVAVVITKAVTAVAAA
mgnify:FL=1